MKPIYWHKQTPVKPLFPELLWSRPENKRTAGKLLIIGGNAHGFAAPAEAYAESVKAGIGTARVLLPDAIRTHLRHFQGASLETEFAPSTPSGSFSQQALADLLEHSSWADAVLIAGDLGRNSETGILIEKFIQKTTIPLTITKDAADYAIGLPDVILNRTDGLLVITMSQLQKLAIAIHSPVAITFGMDLIRLVEALHEITLKYPVALIVKHLSSIVCSEAGNASTTSLTTDIESWRVKTTAYTSVWRLQNPAKPFEATTTGIYESTAK